MTCPGTLAAMADQFAATSRMSPFNPDHATLGSRDGAGAG